MSGAAGGESANGKRKRDDRDDRKAGPKERRLRQRQEEMEEEFAATYHGSTSLYKLLEVQHMRSPLFLPRSLSYRLVPPQQQKQKQQQNQKENDGNKKTVKAELSSAKASTGGSNAAKREAKPEMTTATLREFKIGMTTETIDHFKRDGVRVGLQLSLYTANGHSFASNSFELIATCLIPIPCVKEAKLPKQFLHPEADITVLTVQVVRVTDVIDKLTAQPQYSFVAAPAAPNDVKPTLGAELLQKRGGGGGGREPLFSNLVRIDGSRRRTGLVNMELPAVASTLGAYVVKLQFRVVWEKPTKQLQMAHLEQVVASKWDADYINTKDDVSDQLSVPKRTKPSPWTRRGNTHVWFHYLYHSMLRRMSEKRPDYSCAWCNLYAGSLRGLVSHLVSSHSRFRFHVSAGNDNVPHIFVMPRDVAAIASDALVPNVNASLCELNLDDDKEMDRIEHHFTYISARKRSARGIATAATGGGPAEGDASHDRFHELNELDELAQEKPREFYAPLLQRQYFHSRTGAVVLDHEKDYDSDDDVDEEWITQQSERLLDEFEDVSLEEKEFMKKWNRHVKENRILADFMVASSCRLFAKRHGKWLLASGLRYNFLLHLFNLWDNSLLNSRAIIDCMLIVDHNTVLQEERPRS